MPEVSVIIPVYNTEKYLKKCLESIITQTFRDIEIICLNDDSQDNSLSILEHYVKQDNRVKLISFKNNKGVSAARNEGIKKALGKYIYFMDSDDWIEDNYLEEMVKAIKQSNTDIVLNLNMVSNKDGKNQLYVHSRCKFASKEGEFISSKYAIENTPWNIYMRLYKKSFLDENDLKFPEGYIHNDLYFHYITNILSDKLYIFKGPAYYYRYVSEGIIATATKTNVRDLSTIKIYNLIFDFYEGKKLLDKYDIKMFNVFPFFMVDSEDKYDYYVSYFKKIKKHLEEKSNLYNSLELFFANNILNSKSYGEYVSDFGKNVMMSFVRIKDGK